MSALSPLAGQPATRAPLLDVAQLLAAYVDLRPDPTVPAQRVSFGTSGHRGSAFTHSFNEWHVLAISQAICDYRTRQGISGPLFLGVDTHALSGPASVTALEVFAANGVHVMLAAGDEYTPTPAVSHAILGYNRRQGSHSGSSHGGSSHGDYSGLADGVVITPSHNPPESGGYKYNPPHGGPADTDVTGWIEARANALLVEHLASIKRMPHAQALIAATTHRHDYLHSYVNELDQVLDMALIRNAGLRLGVDPLGGAGVHYWAAIAERFGLDLSVVSDAVDPTFSFMSLDWDGRVRMDPSSRYAMQRLISLKDRFDIAFACDTDHDRHGIVTRDSGLLPANHYLCASVLHLFEHRPQWSTAAAIGKTVVSSRMIDHAATKLGRALYEVPVGFKWFTPGLLDGWLGFGGEESAGASFLRRDGTVWTTDKDGIVAALLAAEITATGAGDPAARYAELEQVFGVAHATRVEAPATPEQNRLLGHLSARQITSTELAGDPIESILSQAPGNAAAIGGIKVTSAKGWFAARPSGTEAIYKIYAESFVDEAHLQRITAEAQAMVDEAMRR